MVHFYYGDGKGKTTAALGLAVRALGRGWRVVLVQFLKGRNSGEINILEQLGVTIYRGKESQKFVGQMNDSEKAQTKQAATTSLLSAWSAIREVPCDLLILDEAATAYQLDLLDRALFEEIVRNKPEQMELVITGHAAFGFLVEASDYVTEMKKVRHPFDHGVKARNGIEL